MQIILSILLYLNVINPTGVYTTTQIRQAETLNRDKIVVVKADRVLLNNIIAKYANKIQGITVLDDGQLK